MENNIKRIIRHVKKKYGGELSTPKNFLCLALDIHEKCGKSISVASIKRIMGYVKYDSRPAERTLNLLANYLGYGNFREFCELTHDLAEDYIYIGEIKVAIGDVLYLKLSDSITEVRLQYRGNKDFVLIHY